LTWSDAEELLSSNEFTRLLKQAPFWKSKPEVLAALVVNGVDSAALHVLNQLENLKDKPPGDNVIDAIAGFYKISRTHAASAGDKRPII